MALLIGAVGLVFVLAGVYLETDHNSSSPAGHHGAVALSSDASAAACTEGQLSAIYWTSLPAMALDLSGATITNVGTATCSLPIQVQGAAVVDAAGRDVSATGFATPAVLPTERATGTVIPPSARVSVPEFEKVPLKRFTGVGWTVTLLNRDIHVRRLALEPGGKAVVVIQTLENEAPAPARCIDPPAGGGLELSLAAAMLRVPVPIMPAPADPAENASGSAFYECGTGYLSPFLTWDQAKAIVGPGESIATRDSAIYNRAP